MFARNSDTLQPPDATGPNLQKRAARNSKLSPEHHARLVAERGAYDSTLQTVPFLSREAWLFEILSLALTVAVLVAMVTLLLRYDEKPNPAWSSGITLNTILSFASMVFRASVLVPVANSISQLCWIWCSEQQRPLKHIVLFDQASRGPLGGLHALGVGLWRYA